MQEKSCAIVLHVLKYNDEHVIVHFYTERRGALCFLVKLPRSKKKSLHTALLSPLSILELDYDYRPHATFQRIKEMRVCTPYKTLPYNPMKTMMALFMGEFIFQALKSEVRNEMLFRYIVASLQWFDMANKGVANFHLVFLMRMTRFLGFMPNVQLETSANERRKRMTCPSEAFFDLREGVLTDTMPLHRDCLMPDEARMLPFVLRMDFSTMHLYKFSRMQRMRILEILILYYRLHIPEFPELNSLEVLRSLL